MGYRADYENALINMFPDILSTNEISRKQITAYVDAKNAAWPTWLTAKTVRRGVYQFRNVVTMPKIDYNSPSVPSVPVPKTVKPIVAPIANAAQSLIPAVDKNYVPFGNHKDINAIVKSGIFYPVYISGPTGNGKSTMVEQICATNKKNLIRVNINNMTDEEQLIGSKTLVDGNVEIVEGPVLIAMRTGATLLLDEIDAGSANTLLCLQPILEGKPFYFKLANELVIPAPGFNIFATANTKGKGSDDGRYIGTNILNEAFLERFAVTMNQEYPKIAIEKRIVVNMMHAHSCYNEEYANTLVKWAAAIRKTFDDGGIDELITTRRLVHIVRAYSIFSEPMKAVELCCNRFDDSTRLAFIDLFDKMTVDTTPIPEVL